MTSFSFMPILWLTGLGSWLAYFGHGRTSLGVALGLVLLLGVDRTASIASGPSTRGGWVARSWLFVVVVLMVQVLVVAITSTGSWLVLAVVGVCLLVVVGGGIRLRRGVQRAGVITLIVLTVWFVIRESLHLGTTHLFASWSVAHIVPSALVHTMGWTVMAGIGLGVLAQQGGSIRARQQVGMSLLVLALVTVWQALATAEGWPLLPIGDALNAAFGHPFVFALLAAAAALSALPPLVAATETAWGSAGSSNRLLVAIPLCCGFALALPQVIDLATSHVSSLASTALTSIEFAQAAFVVLLVWWSVRAVKVLVSQQQRFVEFVPPLCTLAAGGLGAFVIGDAWSTDSALGHGLTLAGAAVVLLASVRDGAVRRPKDDASC